MDWTQRIRKPAKPAHSPKPVEARQKFLAAGLPGLQCSKILIGYALIKKRVKTDGYNLQRKTWFKNLNQGLYWISDIKSAGW